MKKRREEEERLFAKVRTEREMEERRAQKLATDAKLARESMLSARVAAAREELGALQSEITEKGLTSPGSEVKITSKGKVGFGQSHQS